MTSALLETRKLPGLLIVTGAVAVASLLSAWQPVVGPLVWALGLGAAASVSRRMPSQARPGLAYAGKRILRVGVVGLGLQISLGDVLGLGPGVLLVVIGSVAVTFAATRWLGRWLGLDAGTSLMIAAGFSICGASAIAAMDAAAGARSQDRERDVTIAVAMVTVFGSLAIVLMPWLGGLLGLGPVPYGSWVGASVHEVAQVVAAGAMVPGATGVAIAVKLTRVLTLAPMVAIVGLTGRGRRERDAGTPLVPLFVVGFLVAVLVRSSGLLPAAVLDIAARADTLLLTGAMFAMGAGVDLRAVRDAGVRPLVLGALSSALIAVVSYVGLGVAA